MRYTSQQFARALRDLVHETAPAKRRVVIREFVGVVGKHRALPFLPEIIREYEELLDREKKLRHVTVRAPERLPESGVARKLRFSPTQGFGRKSKVKVKSVKDVRLMGGAVVEVDDLRVDNSIARRLGRIREALTR